LQALPVDLLRRERRPAHHVGQQIHPEREAVFHHQHVRRREIAARAGAERAADRIDGLGDFLRAAAGRALIEQLRHERGDAALSRRIVGGAGAHQQSHAHLGLFVAHHDDHLHAVGQRAQLVGRKIHRAGWQRRRREFRRPVRDLTGDGGRQGHDERKRRVERDRFHSRAPVLGRIVSTIRFSGVK
jgi:hypothetical protein